MSDIPSELYNNILSKLPVESLLLFRGVCKSWRQIIDNPAFIESHIESHQSEDGLGQLLLRSERGGKLLSLSLDFIESGRGRQFIDVTQVKNLVGRGLPRLANLPVAICNGLILIPHTDPLLPSDPKKLWVLWNPLTQEYHQLPPCESDRHLCGFGLGYDSTSDDYKVVRINKMCHSDNENFTFVYSLRSDSWKRIKDFPCRLYVSWHTGLLHGNGLYLNGVVYWLSNDWRVIAFDVVSEDYNQFPLPCLRPENPEQREDWCLNLNVLGGCLVFSCNYMMQNLFTEGFKGIKGWVMNDDDGGEIKWDELFSLSEELENCVLSWKNLMPISYCKRLGRVLLQNDLVFYWLNTEDNSAKKVWMYDLCESLDWKFSCQVWQGSLFRIRNVVAAAKRIERGKKKMKAKKRLWFDATITDAAGDGSDSGYSFSSSLEDECLKDF